MLKSLHVKNLALIEEEEIEFTEGLNILSGETGAGKSIILGALGLALGEKAGKGFLRGEEDALVEAIFSVGERETAFLAQMDIDTYDDEVILTRKITPQRSTAKINGESVPAPVLKKVSAVLLAIYGQSEHEFLRKKSKQLAMIDAFGQEEISILLPDVKEAYENFHAVEKELLESDTTDSERERELSFLKHEIAEIEEAGLKAGEDEEIESRYRIMKNSQRIEECLAEAYGLICDEGAGEMAGRAAAAITRAAGFDPALSELADTLSDAEAILSDASRALEDYRESAEFDEKEFSELVRRLDLINDLKSKYGHPSSKSSVPGTIEAVLDSLKERTDRMEKLLSYDSYIEDLKNKKDKYRKELDKLCEKLSDTRKKKAKELCENVKEALLDLNFLDVRFESEFTSIQYTAGGFDEVEFLISLNPGAPLAPLSQVASGGELSRIMLALKTILAGKEDVGTMIFDEIDAGISGRTAHAVAKRLRKAAEHRQVICITHLPQIAAACDSHFLIEKSAVGDSTVSTIKRLDAEESIRELARMLGGDEITDTAIANARELKEGI
ncbi:MAG: DNA repair protein RecN [Lachnospiraceae bacterium]|nr:DNA repair protein RecN [Lachnospiraceae bacterium]